MDEVSTEKISPFNSADPQLWFFMVEATFELAVPKPITASKTKFNYCVAHIPPEAASIVRDIIINPDEEDPYQQLKLEVIKRRGESKTQEVRSLHTGEQFGDRKPSELLRVMQRRAESHHISDTQLLKIFLQQMENNVQSILTVITPLNATKAAEMADKILEVTPPEVSKISSSDSSAIFNSSNSHSDLIEEIRALRKEAASLRRSRSVSRRRNEFRFRKRSSFASKDICWCHEKFQNKAVLLLGKCRRADLEATNLLFAETSHHCRLFIFYRKLKLPSLIDTGSDYCIFQENKKGIKQKTIQIFHAANGSPI
ncbi:hypothetical protein HNY73_004935 [Argiope bruennichi]|uniref:DUF7041 domain-containing protein n=1 Tax=Argiope bruennichi TaxID=94029 RepID=A0A8T0FTC1_ARGBR|nr:hypothetical protein HNY73_004935 [Argiope bruennichi]